MDVKKTPREPMRVFANMNFNWVSTPDEWGSIDFRIRPMKSTERALYKNSLRVVTRVRKTADVVYSLGYTFEECNSGRPGLTKDEIIEANTKWRRVMAAHEIDPEAEKTHDENVRTVLLGCIDSVRAVFDEEEGVTEHPFNEELYESLSDPVVIEWLVGLALSKSTLTDEEKVGL